MVQQVLSKHEVLRATRWSNSTLYQKIKDGKFPKPIKIDPDGRAVGWLANEIEEVQARAAAARGVAGGKAA